MILEIDKIKELIKKPAAKEEILKARKIYSKMDMIVNGNNVAGYLEQITNFENEEQLTLRKKHAKSTKHIFSNVLAPVNKIFSAKGTVIDYILPDKSKKDFNLYLSHIRDGVSLKKWLENNWKNKLHTDPNGLIFVEVDKEGKNPYPTYKSSNSILDYGKSGQYLEYVIFEPEKVNTEGKTVELIRVVDDAYDYIFKKEGDLIDKIDSLDINGVIYKTLPNKHKRVPAILVSDIPNIDKKIQITPIDDCIELAEEYIVDGSIHSIHKFAHGFPLYWEYSRPCVVCEGTGLLDGKKCWACEGIGYRTKKDVSDKITLPIPDENQPKIAPDVAGVVEPAITTWQEYRTELDWLRGHIEFAAWGTHRVENRENETATARFLDVQPVYDKLNRYSESLEIIYKFIVDICGLYMYNGQYKGSSVNFGRRFNIEPPDQILKVYNEARTSGTPAVVLNYMIDQYIQSEFARDNMELTKQSKLLEVEPWKHYTVTEVSEFNIPREEYYKKIYYNEWVSTLTDDIVLLKTTEQLRELFYTYIEDKTTKLNENEQGRQEQGQEVLGVRDNKVGLRKQQTGKE